MSRAKRRSLVKKGEGLMLAYRTRRACELAGLEASCVNTWNQPAGTNGPAPHGTLSFVVVDPRRDNGTGPAFLSFVFVEMPHGVFYAGQGAEEVQIAVSYWMGET